MKEYEHVNISHVNISHVNVSYVNVSYVNVSYEWKNMPAAAVTVLQKIMDTYPVKCMRLKEMHIQLMNLSPLKQTWGYQYEYAF